MEVTFSRHAKEEMERRRVPHELVSQVLRDPEQVVLAHGGKMAYQSRLDFGEGKTFLLRVIVAENVEPPLVVTVYRTSRISKYWRTGP